VQPWLTGWWELHSGSAHFLSAFFILMKNIISITLACLALHAALADNFVGGAGPAGSENSVTSGKIYIPAGVAFWDDFQRPNTPIGTLGFAPSVSAVTKTNYFWYSGANAGFRHTNYYITNTVVAWNDLRTTNSGDACYPTVDLGFKPTYFGCKYHLSANAGSSGTWQAIVFICEPADGNLLNAYHFTLYPNYGLGMQLWGGTGPTNLLGAPNNYDPADWNGVSPAGGSATFQCWIDGAQCTVDMGGYTNTFFDTALTNFGGRYFTVEIFDAGVSGTTNLDNVFIDAVWAGVNPKLTKNVNSIGTFCRFAGGVFSVTVPSTDPTHLYYMETSTNFAAGWDNMDAQMFGGNKQPQYYYGYPTRPKEFFRVLDLGEIF
jgi:hypothetical protein